MSFQTENRKLISNVTSVMNKQVEASERIERLEERVENLTGRLRQIEEKIGRLEKVSSGRPTGYR